MNSKQRRRSIRYWQHTIEADGYWTDDYAERMEWCRKNIGRRGFDWTISYNAGVFQFKLAKHANWFVLKWGNK